MSSSRPDNASGVEHGTPPGQLERDFCAYITQGDRRALGSAVSAVTPRLRRIARHYVRHHDHVEDLVQATILTAIERAETFDSTRPVAPWFTGILLNKVATFRRQSSRRFVDFDDDVALLPRDTRSPFVAAEASEVEQLVAEALEQLPHRYRQVLRLHLQQGKRSGEIASELHRPPGTIRAQLHRGLRRLRTLLPPGLALGALMALRRPAAASQRGPGNFAQPTRGPWARAAVPIGVTLVVATILVVIGRSQDERSQAASRSSATLLETQSPDAAIAGVAPAERPGDRMAEVRSTAELSTPSTAPLRTLAVLTTDRATGARIGSVQVELHADLQSGQEVVRSLVSDDTGRLELPFRPGEVALLRITATRAGYAALLAHWDQRLTEFSVHTPLALPLLRAFPVGGIVTDEAGVPIEGATIHAIRPLLENGRSFKMSSDEFVSMTDSSGRWRMEGLGGEHAMVRLRVSHPKYAPMLGFSWAPSYEELRAMESHAILYEGRSIEITVRDAAGAPIRSARLTLSEPFDPPRSTTVFEGDTRGVASMTLPPAGRFTIVVDAPGFERRILRNLNPNADVVGGVARLDVRMESEGITRVLLVDTEGAPITDGQIRVFRESWSEAHRTDANGYVDLPYHTRASVMAEVRRTGCTGSVFRLIDLSLRRVEFPAVAQLKVVPIDAINGTALTHCRIGIIDTSGRKLARILTGTRSEFDLTFPQHNTPIIVEVSCPGYATYRSSEFQPQASAHEFLAELQPVEEIALFVRGPEGEPIGFYTAAIGTPDAPVQLERWQLLPNAADTQFIQSRGGDTIRLNRPAGEFSVVLSSGSGVAVIPGSSIESSAVVEVSPHCCLSGSAQPNDRVRILPDSLGRSSGVLLDFEAVADKDGQFHFCGLPTGIVRVAAESRPGHSVVTELASTYTARVSL